MPNRILKETICSSEQIDALSPEQEVFFYRLMVVADDFGLVDGRMAILKSKCYPLKSIDIKRIQSNINALVAQDLIFTYEVDGKPYIKLSKWEDHQQIRAKRSKYPMPSEGVITSDINCNQVQSNAPVIQSNPIQSESNPNPIMSADDSAVDLDEHVEGLDLQAWGTWVSYRKKIKKPIKDVSLVAAKREMAGYGADQAAVVQQSIADGYQGLFPLKKGRANANHRNTNADTIAAFTGQRQPAVPEGGSGFVVEGCGTRV